MPMYKDEAKNRYGQLLVVDYAGSDKSGRAKWRCLCSCGKETVVRAAYLRSGYTKSCGCLQRKVAAARSFIDLTGHKYGGLTVVSQEASDERGGARWRCRCDCGGIVVVSSHNMRSGTTKSCGCLRLDTVCLPEGEAAFNQLYNRIKHDASGRGLEFSLTSAQVKVITKQPCIYCGVAPSQRTKHETYGVNGGIIYNGLDRVDNTKGYVMSNVVACCKHCNWAKRDRSVAEFKVWVEQVYKNLF